MTNGETCLTPMMRGAGKIAAIVPWRKRVMSLVLMLRHPGMPVDKKATHEVELEPRHVAAFIFSM